jgi:hypothetical protein
MRSLALLVLLGAGCLDTLIPGHKDANQQQAPADAVDLAEAPQPSDPPAADDAGSMMRHDGGGTHMGDGGGMITGDDGGATPGDGGGLAAFGAPCATNADCQSNICQTIMQMLICTKSCTLLGQADPTCPGSGMCNLNGYCKP